MPRKNKRNPHLLCFHQKFIEPEVIVPKNFYPSNQAHFVTSFAIVSARGRTKSTTVSFTNNISDLRLRRRVTFCFCAVGPARRYCERTLKKKFPKLRVGVKEHSFWVSHLLFVAYRGRTEDNHVIDSNFCPTSLKNSSTVICCWTCNVLLSKIFGSASNDSSKPQLPLCDVTSVLKETYIKFLFRGVKRLSAKQQTTANKFPRKQYGYTSKAYTTKWKEKKIRKKYSRKHAIYSRDASSDVRWLPCGTP